LPKTVHLGEPLDDLGAIQIVVEPDHAPPAVSPPDEKARHGKN
jgi:hypothetical protein